MIVDTDVYADRGEGVRVLGTGPADGGAICMSAWISHEPGAKMPPAKSNKTVTPKELAVIKTWIEEGAKYQKHWSLIAPSRPELPAVKNAAWVKNPIDRFILARLEKEGIAPAPEADRRTLIRRLSFDLTGLPPTPEEVDAFLADRSTDAYEKVVRRLLASPHYGERMASYWLDLVRYADTDGYHSDNHRDLVAVPGLGHRRVQQEHAVRPVHDRADRRRSRADRGLAPEDRVGLQPASADHGRRGRPRRRSTPAKYFADRVRNVVTVWLGLTLGCT